ncbi:Hypothetical protein NTJ_12340 [Nesidiocoris tenuis]|uniref:Uncharacterized protein n=1 Tax=Nesidiocoris tenuis TaxID=355587 RepID=A0ABN7B547_9HEMI|nr:Hypothetical protein NTJ_12340 [Nesidiocoris tenuis]
MLTGVNVLATSRSERKVSFGFRVDSAPNKSANSNLPQSLSALEGKMSNFLCFSLCLSTVVAMPLMSLMDIGDDYFDETIGNFLAADVDRARRVRREPEEIDMGDQQLKRVLREAEGANFAYFPSPDQQTCPELRSADAFPWPASSGAFPWTESAGAFPWPTYAQARTIGGIGQWVGGIGQGSQGAGQGIGGIGQGIGQGIGGIGHGIGHGGIGQKIGHSGIDFGGESIASPVVKDPVVYVTTIPYIAGYKMTPIISEKHVVVKETKSSRSAESAPTVEIWSPPDGAADMRQHPLDLNISFRNAEHQEDCEGGDADIRSDADILDGIPYAEAIDRLQQRIQHLQSLQLARERLNRSDYENNV